jgi:pyruvate formate lyase activating enzyme
MVFYKSFGKGFVRCLACRHYCIIQENGFGLCGVRKNVNNKIVLVTHSKPCSLHLDPIEKKPLYHFLPGSETMSVGFFGCNFGCDFCQNYDISFCRGLEAEKLLAGMRNVSPKDFVSSALENNAKSIAVTYNEPAVSVEYNLEAFELAKKNSLKTVYVSNGYASIEQLKELKKKKTFLDAINIDLKSFNENFYKKVCGSNLENVLACIKDFHKAKVWVELTTLIISGKNDSVEELNQIASFISDLDKNIPWHVSAFFPAHKMNNVSPTNKEDVLRAVKIGKEKGLNFVYGGNISFSDSSNTFCPKCKNLLIKRENYFIESFMNKNKCINCGEIIPGVFK